MIISNTETIQGYNIVEMKGLVSGSVVHSKHIFKDITALLKSLIGGEIKDYTDMMNDARRQAQNRMVDESAKLGANAVVNVRFITNSVMKTMTEVLAYGTAVIVKKN